MEKIKDRVIMLICSAMFAGMLLTGCNGLENAADIYADTEELAKDYDTYAIHLGSHNQKEEESDGSFGMLEGMKTVWEKNMMHEANMTLTYTFQVEKGMAKLVLIAPDDTVTTLFEGVAENGEDDIQEGTLSLEFKEGKYRIKAVGGEDASFEYNFEIVEEQ